MPDKPVKGSYTSKQQADYEESLYMVALNIYDFPWITVESVAEDAREINAAAEAAMIRDDARIFRYKFTDPPFIVEYRKNRSF